MWNNMPFFFLSSQMAKAFRIIPIKKLIHRSTRGRDMGDIDEMVVPKNSKMLGKAYPLPLFISSFQWFPYFHPLEILELEILAKAAILKVH